MGILLAATVVAQDGPPAPPDEGDSDGGGGTNAPIDYTAFYSNNLAAVSQWVHCPYTMPDGSFSDFQTIMDTTASNYATVNTNDWQAADMAAALSWATATGAPATLTDANGNIS